MLPELAAARLLTRAAELDASHASGLAVPDLRAAAVEAGISTRAFDAALAEFHDADQQYVSNVTERFPRHSRRWLWRGLGAAVAGAVAIVVAGRTFNGGATVPGVPTVEEAVLVRCGSPGEASELIRPLLRLPSNTIVIGPHAPRVLRIRGTQEQLQDVKETLAQYENSAGAACPTGPVR